MARINLRRITVAGNIAVKDCFTPKILHYLARLNNIYFLSFTAGYFPLATLDVLIQRAADKL
jgi:hypothetical protein